MLAFHNDSAIKERYVARVKAHIAADEVIQGAYWECGRGCAIGCIIHSSEHIRYEMELGIPRQIAYLQDRIFENLPLSRSKRVSTGFSPSYSSRY